MGKRKETILLIAAHVVCWVIFLSLPTIFNPRRYGQGVSKFFWDMMEFPRWTNGLLFISIFYFNTFYAFPKLYLKQRYLSLLLCVLASFGVFFLLNYLQAPSEIRNSPDFSPMGNSFNLFMYIIVYAFSFVMCLYQQWQHAKEEKMLARISFLTAQINPHFLFNTLNNIYSLSLTQSDKVPHVIVKLSDMMRYSIDEGSQDEVLLDSEISYIRNYIDIHKLRFTRDISIDLQVTGEPGRVKVPPFLILPFVENAFKHGVNGEDNSEICIAIHITNGNLAVDISNTKVPTRPDLPAGTGLGIDTTRQRLELLYPGRYSLVIKDNAHIFAVSLQIRLP